MNLVVVFFGSYRVFGLRRREELAILRSPRRRAFFHLSFLEVSMARGPKPTYHPRFTPEQVAEARRVAARHTEAHVKVLRARMVIALAKNPEVSTPELAQKVGVHEQTARKWRKRWATEGFSLEDRQRPGRQSGFSPSASRSRQSACV